MQIQLRHIQPTDNAVLADIIRSAFHDFHAPTAGTVYVDPTTDHLYEWFQKPQSVCWVAEADAKIAGCCGIFPTPDLPAGCAELVKFYIPAEARGKGIGKMLLQNCIASAREMGYHQIYIESLPAFDTAVGIYEKAGFKKLSHPLGNSGHTGCNIWMLKDI